MPTKRIDVFVFDRSHKPLPGAAIRFKLNGALVGDVPNSGGRGSIEVQDSSSKIEVTVEFGGATAEKTVSPDSARVDFTLDVDLPPAGTLKPPPLTPWGVLVAAIEKTPAAKYALMIAGVLAAASIGRLYIGGSPARSFVVLALMAVGMVGMLAFAKLTQTAAKSFQAPTMFMFWSFVILFVASGAFSVASVFFGKPLDWRPQSSDDRPDIGRGYTGGGIHFGSSSRIDEVGGSGSTAEFVQECDSNEVLVGIDTESVNSFLTRITGVCGRVESDRSTPGLIVSISGELVPVGPMRTGSGVERKRQRCPKNTLVTAVSVTKSRPGDWAIDLVNSATIFCGHPSLVRSGSSFTIETPRGEAVDSDASAPKGPVRCRDNGWVTGFYGRYGEYVDSLGFSCAKPSFQASAR